MSKSYIFPGQGSQFVGMGKDIYETNPKAREMMENANEILGFHLTDAMFGLDGASGSLDSTHITQPAIFLHSVVCAECSNLEKPDMVGGHSLGEFSALVVAGAVSFEDALRLVSIRAKQMQLCCEHTPGKMAAIIGLDEKEIERICRECEGIVIPANYNSFGQVVISGESDAVAACCTALKDAGAKRALPLNVSGAFHSPLMEPARAGLAEAIDRTEIRRPICPVYQNVTALPETDPARIKENLLKQLTSPVLWTQTVTNMIAAGADSFTEIGPGSVLQGLVRRIASAQGKEVATIGIQ